MMSESLMSRLGSTATIRRITTITAVIENIVASIGAHAFLKGVVVVLILLAEKITVQP
eukprot:XP_001707197.1 Hypothetical protein GL50803_32624 [Giardia lamblia ATCC 50803]